MALIISGIVKMTRGEKVKSPSARTMVPWLPWSPAEDIEESTNLKETKGKKNESFREEEPKFDKF